MKKIKVYLNLFFIILGAIAFVFGFITNFITIEGSKDMSRMGVEWYQLTHYWYCWVTGLICVVGFILTTKR